MRSLTLVFPWLVACAATPAPARCPAPPPTESAAARPAAAIAGEPVAPLLERSPAGSDVIVRVDVQRIFGTRLGRVVAPFAVWSQEYRTYRAACTERPWEVVRAVEGVYRDGHMAVALLGPVAGEGHGCAPTVMEVPDVSSFRAREADGGAALVLGDEGSRAALAAARAGEGAARGDDAFRELPPGMAAPLVTVLVRGGAYRDALDFLDTLRDEARERQGDEAPRVPRLELASSEVLRSLRGVRIEAAMNPAGELEFRMTMLFPSAEDARRYVTLSREDMRTRVPEYLARLLASTLRENPDAPRAAQASMAEAVGWLDETLPLEARGSTAEVSFAGSGSFVISLGVLSAVAIPAFTRYVKRSKTTEATANISRIVSALTDELNRTPAARRRLVAIPPTPAEAPSNTRYAPDPARWNTPAWRRLNFSIATGHYYQYRVDVEGRCYVVTASGDLDGDATRSTFSRRLCPQPDGTYAGGPFQIVNELE